MEVVIVASAVSQLALRLVDKYSKRKVANAQGKTMTEGATRAPPNNTGDSLTRPEQTKPPEEGSIASLELKLKNLRLQAKELTSPETFVQYARVSREANKVEKQLNEKREEEGIRENGLEIENISRMFSNALAPSATGIMHRKARSFALKLVVRVFVLFALWWYFSWNPRVDKGSVMVIDCQAIRPLHYLLTKKTPSCTEGDWVCSARSPECRISFTLAFGMCNLALAMIAKAFS